MLDNNAEDIARRKRRLARQSNPFLIPKPRRCCAENDDANAHRARSEMNRSGLHCHHIGLDQKVAENRKNLYIVLILHKYTIYCAY